MDENMDEKWKEFNELTDRRTAITEKLLKEIRKKKECNYEVCDKLLKEFEIELAKMDEWAAKYNCYKK